MNIDTTLLDDHAVLTLKGEFDTFHCPRFQEEIEDILERDINFILLNMRLVKFINSTALGAIIRASKMCKVDDGQLLLAGPSTFVRDIVSKLGIDQLVPVFDDEDSAVKHVIKALNAQDFPETAPVREEKVLISFSDDTRNKQLGGKRSLVGTMSNVDSEKVQFLFNGSRIGVSADQAKQLFFKGSEANLKFQVKLIRKGHFDVVAVIEDTETATDDNVRVTATFKKIKQGERDALGQFAEDMKNLKNQIPGS
jgi:anti-anti-sigma factor